MTTTKILTGREYLRVSLDRSGRARSVDEQHDDNQRAADEFGWHLGKPYRDVDRSASRYATKAREDYDQLIADLEHGRFNADVLVLWESSRGSRKVSEWVTLIELAERAGVRIHVTTHNRTYDPANARDRRSLLEDSVDSEYESSKISDRARRAAAANAADGKPHGPTPYGYRRLYDPETRRLVRQEPNPDEAAVVRELFDRLRRGHSLRSIAMDFDARGQRTRTGKPFSSQHLRDMALTATYIGLRVHAPGQKGTRSRYDLKGAVKGTWEPLVSEETYYEVRRMLTRPERRTSRSGRATHLLSMIAKCDVCGGPLAVAFRPAAQGTVREMYQCRAKGCVRLDKADLDALAEKVILDFLSADDVFEKLESSAHNDDELQQVRNDLQRARTELQELRDDVSAGRLSVANLREVGPGLEARVATLEAREKELATPSVLRGLIAPGKGVRRRWKATPITAKRDIVRGLLSPEHLGELRVDRRPPGSGNKSVPADQRVRWHRE
jgi:DNA invertase Pin-like site-specific DNA recombinase